MTTKADFNGEEWQRVLDGPALAGMIVITAQRGGTLRESIAMGKVYGEARKQHGESDLVGEVASSVPKVDPKRFSSAEDLRLQGAEEIRAVVGLLEAKATAEEVDAYRAFAMTVAERAAEADKSGGVLGIGGERVSESESAALDEVAAALGTQRAPHSPSS